MHNERVIAVYRPCPCGETAHDFKGQLTPGLDGSPEVGGWMIYECRNCGRHIVPKTVRTRAAHARHVAFKAAKVAASMP